MEIDQELQFSKYREQYKSGLIDINELRIKYFQIFMSPEIKNKVLEYKH